MIFGQKNEMEVFSDICKYIIPQRISLITNYGEWEDRILMKGPHLNISIIDQEEDMKIRISDERGLTVEIPCEGIEIVELQETNWDFEAHVYFFTFGGFARINIIGHPLNKLTDYVVVENNYLD